MAIPHTSLQYLISSLCLTADLCITLDSITVENIVKNFTFKKKIKFFHVQKCFL